MSYSQLSASERYEIYRLRHTTELSMRAIARQIGRSQSALSRELARNQSDTGLYLPDQAHQKMQERRRQSKTAFNNIAEACIGEIKQRLKAYHSPEQIAGRLKLEGRSSISHETIHQLIYADHQGLKEYQKY